MPLNLIGDNLGCNGDQDGQISYNPTENALFWRHMYFGGYIKPLLSQAWKTTAPTHIVGDIALSAAKFNKNAIYFPDSGGVNNFVIRVVRPNDTAVDQPFTAVISGEMIVAIEGKYDDGIANTGLIGGANGAYGNGEFQYNCLANTTTYGFRVTPELDTGCVMWIGFVAY